MLPSLRRLVATSLLVAPALAAGPLPSAAAAGETCDGLAATMVGTPGGRVVGTQLDDVIVSNGADYVDGAGGNDVICTTASVAHKHSAISVSGGSGVDVIDRRGDLDPAVRALVFFAGEGGTFHGGPGPEQVSIERLQPATAAYAVATGDGEDSVFLDRTTQLTVASAVDLGAGDDLISVTDTVANLQVAGGDGVDTLTSGNSSGPRWIQADTEAGLVTFAPGQQLPVTGFETYRFELANPRSHVDFHGSPADETVELEGRGQLSSARLGSGDDVVRFDMFTKPRTRLKGGAGRDRLELLSDHESDVHVDLAERWFTDRAHHRNPLRQFEDVAAMGGMVTVVGDGRDNELLWWGCSGGSVSGGGGNDTIAPVPPLRVCSKVELQASGGAGNDRVTGGPGHDVLDGGPGRDRCLAGEVLRGCERRS